jgi:hypothetical protein
MILLEEVNVKGRQVLHLSMQLCLLTIIGFLSFITYGRIVSAISHGSGVELWKKSVLSWRQHSGSRYRIVIIIIIIIGNFL